MKSIMSFLTESLLSLIDIIGTIIFEAIPGFITELTKQTPSMIEEIVKNLFMELIPGLIKAIVDAIKKAGKSAIVSPYKKTKRWVKRQKWNFHDGGMIGAYKAHQGMFVSPRLAPDEVPIIAQAGEAVLNRQATANAGGEAGINAMNNGGSGGVTINNILQPKHLLSADTAKVLDDMIGSNIAAGVGQVAAAISGEDVDGFDSRR